MIPIGNYPGEKRIGGVRGLKRWRANAGKVISDIVQISRIAVA
jgi:hypothetical protein